MSREYIPPSQMTPEELKVYRWAIWAETFGQLIPQPGPEIPVSFEGIGPTLALVEQIADRVVEIVLRKREEMLK